MRLIIRNTNKFKNDPELTEEWETLQSDIITVSYNNLLPGNTVFSGVFDTQTETSRLYPSGSTTYANGSAIPEGYIVPTQNGHRYIKEKMIEYLDDLSIQNACSRVIGFTVKYENLNEFY